MKPLSIIVLLVFISCGERKSSISSDNRPETRTESGLEQKPTGKNFHTVKEKFCDNRKVEIKIGERLFIDLNNAVIGIGHTDGDCKVVDFKSVVISGSNYSATTVSVRSSLGRRSTCLTGIHPYDGLEYSEALVQNNVIELLATEGDCSSVIYKF
jgi:hypothetical protein